MRTKKRTKPKKPRTGVDRRALLAAPFTLFIAPAVLAQRRRETAHAIVAGTVFREPGFAVPRAGVMLAALSAPPGVKNFKPLKTLTDARGEFVIRVPAGQARYLVRAAANGLVPEEKQVDVNADERVDVYFILKALSK